MRPRDLMNAVILMTVAACASAPRVTTDAAPIGRSSDVLTVSEMRDAQTTDVFQAISMLRPMFLHRGRETSPFRPTASLLTVYLDNVRLGSLDALRTMPIESVKTVQYLSSSEATMRWGTNHTGGVILLSTVERR